MKEIGNDEGFTLRKLIVFLVYLICSGRYIGLGMICRKKWMSWWFGNYDKFNRFRLLQSSRRGIIESFYSISREIS